MAVAEIAISEGKSAGERTADSSANMPQQTGLSILSFSLMLAVGMPYCCRFMLRHALLGTNNAPSNQRPYGFNSANGTSGHPKRHLNLASLNQYQQFDVEQARGYRF